jgi:hypothetical protein
MTAFWHGFADAFFTPMPLRNQADGHSVPRLSPVSA